MRVTQSGNSTIQGSESASARKTDKAAKTEKAKVEAGKSTESATGVASESAKTEISAQAKDMLKAKAIATNAPEVREAKIAELRKKIADGKYAVDNQAVADRMVDDHLKSGIG